MSTPAVHHLDPAHILAVINQATPSPRGNAARARVMTEGVRVHLLSRPMVREATAALRRVGYQVHRFDTPRQCGVLVTGWSATALESRLAVMRVVIHQLSASPAVTASATISRARATEPTPPDEVLLAGTGARLRSWVAARSGIQAPCHPSLPEDRGIALQLRQATRLEYLIEDLIEANLQITQSALALFGKLRPHFTDPQAHQEAIRRSGLAASPDAPPPLRHAAQLPGPVEPFVGAAQGTQPPPPGPARMAASGFPRSVHDAVALPTPGTRSPRWPDLPRRPPGCRR